MTNFISRFKKDESGATAIEYGMIAALIGVAVITVLVVLGPKVGAAFQGISDKLPEAASGS